MAFSYTKYNGNGSTQTYAVPFPYLERRHVEVTVNNVRVGFSWLSNALVRLSSIPASGAAITVRRRTPNDLPLVDFTDGATLTERDLDLMAMQAIFVNQESLDFAEELADALEDETEEGITALRSSIKNVLVTAQRASALATIAGNVSEEAITIATTTRDYVMDTAGQVRTDADRAFEAGVLANQLASEALTSAGVASSASADALARSADAAASAADALAAAQTATAAANFNPEDFYTRPQMAALLSSVSFAQSQISGLGTALSGKANASHSHSITNVSGLQSALDGKLSATGVASAAAKLHTPRTITLTNDVTGTITFDGSSNVSAAVAVLNDSHKHSFDTITGLETALSKKVETSYTLTAGSGLVGLGTLTTPRTVSLGTPSAITATSTNSVTATSHTHSLSEDAVRELISAGNAGELGTYAIHKDTDVSGGARFPGATVAGSLLRYATVAGNDGGRIPSGTWRLMGRVADTSIADRTGLWLRIA